MKRETLYRVFDVLSRLLLGGVFIYASWTKIQDPSLFAQAIASYRILPADLTGFFALVLPMLEMVAGVALVFTRWSREAALILRGLLLVFLVGLVQAQMRDLDISCGCFGEEANEESSLLMSTIRVVLLLVPATWLVIRPGSWIFGRCPPVAPLLALVFALGGTASASGAEASEVRPEAWTQDFPAARARAEAEHRPLLLFGASRSCKLCKRTGSALDNKVFDAWAKGSGIYLSRFYFDETNAAPAQAEAAKFLLSLPLLVDKGVPYVGVYWPRPDGDAVRAAFTFRREAKLGTNHPALMGRFATVVDRLLADYFSGLGAAHPSVDELLASVTKRFSVSCEGDGTVSMEPADGVIRTGMKLKVTAMPAAGAMLVGWRCPDGRMQRSGHSRTLVLTFNVQEGVYTAVFQKK